MSHVVGRPEPQTAPATPDEVIEALTIWPGVGFRHLAAFVAIAEERSFRGAAKRLRYAQPTVSHQMAALERAVGGELIERGSAPQSARPSPAGEALLEAVHELAELLAAARRELTDRFTDERSPRPSRSADRLPVACLLAANLPPGPAPAGRQDNRRAACG